MVAVALQQVTKLFGRFAALRSVTAEFSAGRCYAIFGENGAGKSTLLRVIAGLARPTSGKVVFSSPQEMLRQKIGYVPHASMLYDELSAMENLRYFGALYGIIEEQKFTTAIRAVGLDPNLGRHVGDYSQGMRQRLSLARMLMHDPEILLLDEPFSNLDVASAREITALIARLRDESKTILVVTHQMANVAEIADYSLLFAQGVLLRCEAGVAAARTGSSTASSGGNSAQESRAR